MLRCNPIGIGKPRKSPAADVILTSYYVDIAHEAGYADEDSWVDTALFGQAAMSCCIAKAAKRAPADEWPALDLALMSAQLIHLGMRGRVRLAKELIIGKHHLEMAWPLGMALRTVSTVKAASERHGMMMNVSNVSNESNVSYSRGNKVV